jgi:uncharacterized protein
VVPVNYVMIDDGVVFRTAPGSKLAALQERPVSFQVDEVDETRRTGWSVLIQGIGFVLAEAPRGIDVEPWAPGDKDVWVRIIPGAVTGRRIRIPLWPVDGRAYL